MSVASDSPILALQRSKHADVERFFREHREQVRSLQHRALDEILPDIAAQQELSKEDVCWLETYIADHVTIFRILKRHKFISTFTYEAIRSAVVWRLRCLNRSDARVLLPHAITLLDPSVCRDVLNRPVALLRVSQLDFHTIERTKGDAINVLESMRLVMQDTQTLQYVLVVDVKDASLKSIPVELVSWYLKEVQPWYNGVVGSAFIVNYSWKYSGLWSILKLLLPASMMSKVSCPSHNELPELFPKDSVQQILRNTPSFQLPPSMETEPHPKPLIAPLPTPPPTPPLMLGQRRGRSPRIEANVAEVPSGRPPASIPFSSVERTLSFSRKSWIRIESNVTNVSWIATRCRSLILSTPKCLSWLCSPRRFSEDNPFFGYPVVFRTQAQVRQMIASDNTSNTDSFPVPPGAAITKPNWILQHGRRRKRDLAITLLIMYWKHWGPLLRVLSGGITFIFVLLLLLRRRIRIVEALEHIYAVI